MKIKDLTRDVQFSVETIAAGVRECATQHSLTPAQLKLFYTVLVRTKGYLLSAQEQIRRKKSEIKQRIWDNIYCDGDEP